MKIGIVVFPGTWSESDTFYATNDILGFNTEYIWHKDQKLSDIDLIILPGGFSYGDYLRTGAIARFSPIMNEVINDAKKGKPIIGICNGFQILLESGLLPGALINNKNIKFLSQNVMLNVVTNNSIFSNKIELGKKLIMPIAHKQGNYIADDDTIDKLEQEDRIVFKYYRRNPNGSINDIAGIINKKRNVLGMMPHPERACDKHLGSVDGKLIFESILGK